MTTQDRVKALSTITNRDHAGRHFTERYPDDVLADLESAELVAIDRPIHQPTGIPYDQQYWTLEVTQDGQDLVDANPEYWDSI